MTPDIGRAVQESVHTRDREFALLVLVVHRYHYVCVQLLRHFVRLWRIYCVMASNRYEQDVHISYFRSLIRSQHVSQVARVRYPYSVRAYHEERICALLTAARIVMVGSDAEDLNFIRTELPIALDNDRCSLYHIRSSVVPMLMTYGYNVRGLIKRAIGERFRWKTRRIERIGYYSCSCAGRDKKRTVPQKLKFSYSHLASC